MSAADRSTHLALLSTRFEEALLETPETDDELASYTPELVDYLWQHLDKVLAGTPDELAAIVRHIDTSFRDFHAHSVSRSPNKKTAAEQEVHEKTFKLIERCFDYDRFAKKKQGGWGAYALVASIEARICPYCQLHHVNYHLPSSRKSFSLRPPLDHFLPRSSYPYLAVSLSNLIPSCSQCNSGIKIAMDPLVAGLAHPRDDARPLAISFSAAGSIPVKAGGNIDTVKLSLSAASADSDAHATAFKLADRYQWYRHEVLDLMKNFDRFLDYPDEVRQVILQDDFILGFSPTLASERAAGICLLDIYRELKAQATSTP